RDRTTELRALLGVGARDLERAARDADGLRGDVDTTAVEPGHRDGEPLAGLAEDGVVTDPGALEDERARVRCAKTVLALGRADRHTRGVERHDEGRDPGARVLRIELAHAREHDREGRVTRIGDELLPPLDPPTAAVRPSRRAKRCGIAAGG